MAKKTWYKRGDSYPYGEKKAPPKHGRPWDIEAKFESFSEADAKRQLLTHKIGELYDIKVKRLSEHYVVKKRLKEEFLQTETESKSDKTKRPKSDKTKKSYKKKNKKKYRQNKDE